MTASVHAPSGPAEDGIEIRGKPRDVRRFSRKALIIIAFGLSVFLALTLGFASMPKRRQAEGAHAPELYSSRTRPVADGVNALPASYDSLGQTGPRRDPLLNVPLDNFDQTSQPSFEGASLAARDRLDGVDYSNSGIGPDQPDPRIKEAQDALRSSLFVRSAPAARGEIRMEADLSHARSVTAASRPGAGLAMTDPSIYNPHDLQTPSSPNTILSGTIIRAALLTGINSDLAGPVIAQVSEPVFDTVTGRIRLIPQGTRLIGDYESETAYGQSRALVRWTRLILPDGSSLRLENLAAVDETGRAGLKGKVNAHGLRLFQAAALSSLISAGAEIGEDDDEDLARALREAVQSGSSRAGDEIIRRDLRVKPTLEIKPGTRLGVIVHQDLVLKPYEGP